MCAICGCSTDHAGPGVRAHVHPHADGHAHADAYAHALPHPHAHGHATLHDLEVRVLAHNDAHAANNRRWFAARGIVALNLTSSPGAGKTTLLERTIRDVGGELSLAVIEGDQETDADARRIRETGCAVIQLNTGTGCHLDATMIERALDQLSPRERSIVMIENVGNLVCPALFDLGERAKVVVSSVTEGDDKPLKYPHMFRAAGLVLLNKLDLLAHVPFEVERFTANVSRVNPNAAVMPLSALRGEGLDGWYHWLRTQLGA
jgi:hydrogenase nickel incorporation protein HypB